MEAFENGEKRQACRCFELMYRNLLDGGRVIFTIEYAQQFGIHPKFPQEVAGYSIYG